MLDALKRIQVDPLEQLFKINDNTPLIFPEEVAHQLTHVLNFTKPSDDDSKDLFIVRPMFQNKSLYSVPDDNDESKKHKITPESLAYTELFYKQLIYSIGLIEIFLSNANYNKPVGEMIYDSIINEKYPSFNYLNLNSLIKNIDIQ